MRYRSSAVFAPDAGEYLVGGLMVRMDYLPRLPGRYYHAITYWLPPGWELVFAGEAIYLWRLSSLICWRRRRHAMMLVSFL